MGSLGSSGRGRACVSTGFARMKAAHRAASTRVEAGDAAGMAAWAAGCGCARGVLAWHCSNVRTISAFMRYSATALPCQRIATLSGTSGRWRDGAIQWRGNARPRRGWHTRPRPGRAAGAPQSARRTRRAGSAAAPGCVRGDPLGAENGGERLVGCRRIEGEVRGCRGLRRHGFLSRCGCRSEAGLCSRVRNIVNKTRNISLDVLARGSNALLSAGATAGPFAFICGSESCIPDSPHLAGQRSDHHAANGSEAKKIEPQMNANGSVLNGSFELNFSFVSPVARLRQRARGN